MPATEPWTVVRKGLEGTLSASRAAKLLTGRLLLWRRETSDETPRPFALPRVRKVVPEPAHPPGNKDSPCDHQQDR